ncbi:MAG: YajQ family cyclic di-GMP-binding protein [Nitrospira sp.]|nr:YajQ family cyclic di-GMP-binding protein [Candidatus Manganitrophaceae bacterium]HIL35575.1 YajQ family cyclic di-GMP-binding protein [Candidatus Manganitrophaceae bacterium]
MASTSSFDVVSKVDIQEVKNAVETTTKELRQRFDLKGTKSEVKLENEKVLIISSSDEFKLKAVNDILQSKLLKRGISLKALVYEKIEQALGGTARQKITLQQGISQEKAKAVGKAIRDSKLKVQSQIQGEHLRVSGKSKDDLQEVMALLKSKDFDIDLQFENYR